MRRWGIKLVSEPHNITEKGTMKLVIIYCEGGAIYVSVLITEKLCCETIISKLRPDLPVIFNVKRLTFKISK